MGELKAADGLRGIACLMVLVCHCLVFNFPAINPIIIGVPKVGVWLFFVLSAFLLTERLSRTAITPRTLADYSLSRFLRIVPAFIVAVALYWAIGQMPDDRVFGALTFQDGWAHLWTIPVETHFYLALPVILATSIGASRAVRADLAAPICIGLAIVASIMFPFWQTPKSAPQMHYYISVFLFGVASNAYARKHSISLGTSTLVFVLSVATIVTIIVASKALDADDWIINKYSIFGAAWAVALFAVAASREQWSGVLTSAPLRYVGKISYSIYLFHWVFATKLGAAIGGLPGFVSSIIASLLIGTAGFHLIEKPCMRLRFRATRSDAPDVGVDAIPTLSK